MFQRQLYTAIIAEIIGLYYAKDAKIPWVRPKNGKDNGIVRLSAINSGNIIAVRIANTLSAWADLVIRVMYFFSCLEALFAMASKFF